MTNVNSPNKGGAPIGNQNARNGKRWAHAIQRAVDAWPARAVSLEVNRGIDNLAFEFVSEMVATRDIAFFREYGDRIDGKPAMVIAGDDELPPVRVGVIRLVGLTTADEDGEKGE